VHFVVFVVKPAAARLAAPKDPKDPKDFRDGKDILCPGSGYPVLAVLAVFYVLGLAALALRSMGHNVACVALHQRTETPRSNPTPVSVVDRTER